ncbi:hypothetical protein R3P38DRAFT_2892133 [Favolaschia claudopus]|uniref:Uncharacterized protein n=1 Tax=Favolaschia claudopus TaxID=2862362 RepID=A0AAW0CSH4_9AGAR
MEAPASSTSVDSIRTIHFPPNQGSLSSPSASPPSSPSSPASSVSSFPSVSSSFFFSSAAASPPHPHPEHQGVQQEGEGVEETLIIPSLALPAPLLIQRLPPPHTRTHTLVPLSNRHRPSQSRRRIDGPTTRLLVIGDVDAVAAALLPAHPHHHRESDVWASAGEEEDEDGSRVLRLAGDPAIELVALGGDVEKIDFTLLHHRLLRPFHRLSRLLAPPPLSSLDGEANDLLTSLVLSPESPLYTALLVLPPQKRQSATTHASEPTLTLTTPSTASSSSLETQSDPSSIAIIPRGPPPSIVSGSAATSSTSLSSGAAPVSSPSAVDADPPPPTNQDSSPTDPQSNGNRIANPAADAILAAIPEVIRRLVPVIVVPAPAPAAGDDDAVHPTLSSSAGAGARPESALSASTAARLESGAAVDSSFLTFTSTSSSASTSTSHDTSTPPSTSTSSSNPHNPGEHDDDNEPGTARLPAPPPPLPSRSHSHLDANADADKAQDSQSPSKPGPGRESSSPLRDRLTARPARLAAARCFVGWWRAGGGYEYAGYAGHTGYDYAGYGDSQPFGYSGVQDGGEGEEVYHLRLRRRLDLRGGEGGRSTMSPYAYTHAYAYAAHDPLNLSSILRLAGEVWRAWRGRGSLGGCSSSPSAPLRRHAGERKAWMGGGTYWIGVGAFVCGVVFGVGVGRLM